MNGFEMHNIKHSSASQINKWATAPCAWIAEKLYGHRFKVGCAAIRGFLIEEAVVNILANDWDIQTAIDDALKNYDARNALNTESSLQKNRDAIEPIIRTSIEALKPYGKPEFTKGQNKQEAIELVCNGEGWSLPIIGYMDLYYPDHGLVIDLKTTLRMPSVMTPAHERQAAIYEKAIGNKGVRFLYVTPKKHGFLECADIEKRLSEIKTLLNRQEAFLRVSADKETLKNIVPVNTDTFYWSNALDIRREMYGI